MTDSKPKTTGKNKKKAAKKDTGEKIIVNGLPLRTILFPAKSGNIKRSLIEKAVLEVMAKRNLEK